MNQFHGFAGILLALCSALSCQGQIAPTAATLPNAQRAALQKAVCFAEPKEVVQHAFADLAVAPAGTSQQDLLKKKLRSDNLSMFCMAGPLNQEGAAAAFEYETPALEQIAQAAMQTATQGTVVSLDDLENISWVEAVPGLAHGSFRYDTKSGNRGICLFRARQEGATWRITQLVIRKKGSDRLEDGFPVLDHTESTE